MTKEELVERFKESPALPDDWGLIDVDLLRSAAYEILPFIQEDVVDYDEFLTGKTAIAYGLTPNEKRWLRRHVEEHHGKFKFTYGEGIDIYIMSSVCDVYGIHMALEGFHRSLSTVFVDYDLFIRHFDDLFDDAKEEEIKAREREEEKRAKANRKPTYDVCPESYLKSLPKVSAQDLDIDSEVFHVIGKTEKALRDAFESAFNSPEPIYLRDYPYVGDFYSTKQIYALIDKKGGRFVKKEESPNITCIIYGSEPSTRTIKLFEGRTKFISVVDAVNWLKNLEDVNQACRVFAEKYVSSTDARLRPYQQMMKNEVFRQWKRHFNVMLQLPTGTGKTVLFTSIIRDLSASKGTKIVILAHRKELIDQISEHLSRYELEHGIIASGRVRRLELNVQVASVQTLTHEKNIDLIDELKPQFIIIDEAHHSLADTYTKFWKHCGDCWKLGVTATPYRLNNKSFRSHFNKFIEAEPIDDFIQVGYLAEYDFLVDNPRSSLSQTIKAIKEKSTTGDYKTATLLKELNVEQHIQRLIVCYEQYVKGKKGIVYAINKEHARNICEAYQVIGVAAVYIDSDTQKRERAEIVEKFVRNEIQVMVNVDIFSEGFDCPDVEFIQLARPTWSLAKYLQQVGRGLRPCLGKQKTVILDNSRMFVKFGLPSEKRLWEWHFNGDPLAKNLYKQENMQNEADLMLVSRYSDEMMVKMNNESVRQAEEQKREEERHEYARLRAIEEARRREHEEKRRQEEDARRREQEAKRLQQEEAERRFEEAKAEEESRRRERLERIQAEQKAAEEERRRKWEELARQKREEQERKDAENRAYREAKQREREELARIRQQRKEQEERIRLEKEEHDKQIDLIIKIVIIIVFIALIIWQPGLLIIFAIIGLISAFK